MKKLTSPLLLFMLFLASGQDQTVEQLKYQLRFSAIAEKSKTITDPQLKGLLATQLFRFHSMYGQNDFENLHYVYPTVYNGVKALIVDSIYSLNSMSGMDFARYTGDSIFNQYHGHMQHIEHMPRRYYDKRVDVRTVVLSHDGKSMYSAGGDGRLLRWNSGDRSYVEIYRSEKVDRVVNISPNEKWLALATNDNEIDLFDLDNLSKKPKKLQGHAGAVYDLVFFKDNSGFVSIGADKKILTSDFETESELTTVTGIVKTLALSPDGKTLATGAINGEIVLIDLKNPEASPRQIFRKNMDSHPVQDLNFSNDGRFLAIGGYNNQTGTGYINIWEISKHRPFGSELVGFTAPVNNVEFSPDDQLIAATSNDQTVRIWSMKEIYDLPIVFDDHKDWVFDLAFHPDGQSLFTASADGLIRKFPLNIAVLGDQLCDKLSRNLSEEEWRTFIGDLAEYPWEATCPNLPKPKME